MQLLQGGCLSKSTTGLDGLQEMEEHRLLLGGEGEICILICHVMAVNIVSYEKHLIFFTKAVISKNLVSKAIYCQLMY